MTRVGDLASEVAENLQIQMLDDVEPEVDEEGPMRRETGRNIFSKIEFRWRRDDEKIVEQIRAAVDRLFKEMFEDAVAVMDDFYAQMRVPVVDEETGVVEVDSNGRVVFKKDSRDREIEDWSQLTGQDIEKALLDITRLKLVLAPQLNDLLLEAVFAKHIADDKSHDAYAAVLDGTVKDRDARASRESRQEKYHAFFRYYLYSHAETFMKELNNFARVLERIRYWRLDESGR